MIKDEFERVKGIYGYRRITVILRDKYNLNINHKKVRRLMNEIGIRALIRVKKFKYMDIKNIATNRIAPNILERKFESKAPFTKLTTDISYLKFDNGSKTLYLSVIKDLYNNEILSYKLSKHLDINFVLDTVNDAIKGIAYAPDGVILHSDQGFHYTSNAYTNLLDKLKLTCSMYSKGNCFDNASQESFFSHLKSELFYFKGVETFDEMYKLIDEYIYFYNNERIQNKLGNLSPINYRKKIA